MMTFAQDAHINSSAASLTLPLYHYLLCAAWHGAISLMKSHSGVEKVLVIE